MNQQDRHNLVRQLIMEQGESEDSGFDPPDLDIQNNVPDDDLLFPVNVGKSESYDIMWENRFDIVSSPKSTFSGDTFFGKRDTHAMSFPVAVGHAIRRVKPFIWVRNDSKSSITVIVSEHRPRIIGYPSNLGGGPGGASLGISTVKYSEESGYKDVPPGVCRSWHCSSRNRYMVVSVFQGEGKTHQRIGGEPVKLGYLACYDGTSQLRLFNRKGLPVAPPAPPA